MESGRSRLIETEGSVEPMVAVLQFLVLVGQARGWVGRDRLVWRLLCLSTGLLQLGLWPVEAGPLRISRAGATLRLEWDEPTNRFVLARYVALPGPAVCYYAHTGAPLSAIEIQATNAMDFFSFHPGLTAPNIGFLPGSFTCLKGIPCVLGPPTNSGGPASAFTIAPPLPAGLSLDPQTGVISGTPATATLKTTYAVTASNLAGLSTTTVRITCGAEGPGPPFAPPMERLIASRPRLFINATTLPAVVSNAVTAHSELLGAMRSYLGGWVGQPRPPADYGVEAVVAAFLYLCDGDARWLNLGTNLLALSVAYYRQCDQARQPVNWYSATRIQAITAYDWLYEAMAPELRAQLGGDLLAHVEFRVLSPLPGDNHGDYRSGFYGELSLPWYIGIAAYGTGLDDAKCAAGIALGYDQQMRLLQFRREAAGDDGGGATTTLGYALAAYPWAEFNFFHTMKSAFGLEVAQDWPHVATLPQWALWNRVADHYEFGAGDAFHSSNEIPEDHLYTHLAQIRHFYGRAWPEQAALAAWLQGQLRLQAWHLSWPLTPFLLTELNRSPAPQPPSAGQPLARHFEAAGQFFLRSGWGADDTYALFTAGGFSDIHKHFDENSFVLYHRGFLALDSGTRPEPGSHLFQYYCRTVAHNSVLIRMEGEVLPGYWGSPAPGEPVLPVANDGGMCKVTGAVVRAFCTTPHYTYIASDATACYHPAKCRLATRQFLHIQPDVFVVFDRVVSTRPEHRKSWLLHTAREPVVTGLTAQADQGEGRLFCRTLLPHAATLTKIGGPGQEFWNDGRNWPLPPGWPQTELMGAWRLEVSPATPATDDLFLHVIQVGPRQMPAMIGTRLLSEAGRVGVEFDYQGATWTVLFDDQGDLGGELRVARGADVRVVPLRNAVQLQ